MFLGVIENLSENPKIKAARQRATEAYASYVAGRGERRDLGFQIGSKTQTLPVAIIFSQPVHD